MKTRNLNLIKGCQVPFPELLFEQYQKQGNKIVANVGADKIADVLYHFLSMHEEPIFFILELPCHKDVENEAGTLHRDVYYRDGCSQKEAETILLRIGELLINDGLCTFGFGCHDSKDEIMVGKYNVVTIFSNDIQRYHDFYGAHDIPEADQLITAWDTFSEENPGKSEKYISNGKNIFSIPEDFKDWGLYFAERREEK